jgi:tetratricopeptide (TPR) repeat protein
VNAQLLLILVGLMYVFIVGVMALLRREGLSGQCAVETLVIIGLALLVGWATGLTVDPIILFIVLYLVTMRARLLTDLANLLFKRRGYAAAERLYRLALRLFPDRTGRFVVLVNWGIAHLQAGDVESAITTLKGVLADGEENGLGHKYEAACRYNLAVAHRKAGDDAAAAQQFEQVIELFPSSIYGHAAERAMKKRRERGLPKKE